MKKHHRKHKNKYPQLQTASTYSQKAGHECSTRPISLVGLDVEQL